MNRNEWYDGDTFYDDAGQGHRLYGADTPERKVDQPGWRQAREASQLAEQQGYQLGAPAERETYGRQLQSMEAPDGGPTLEAELLGAGLGSGLHPSQAGGTYRNEYLGGARALRSDPGSALANHPEFLQAAEDARFLRLQRLQDGLANGSLTADLDRLQAIRDPRGPEDEQGVWDQLSKHGVLGRGFARGTDNMQATFYGFAEALGGIAGIDPLKEWGADGVAQNIVEAMRNPATVRDYEDIDGLADAGVYALEALAEFSPQLLADATAAIGSGGLALVGRHALAGVGKAMLRNAGGSLAVGSARQLAGHGLAASPFVKGAKAGAFLSMYVQSSGETQMELAREGIDSPETALLVGGAKAALEYGSLTSIFKGVAGRFAAGAEKTPERMAQLLGSALAATGAGFAKESTTEMAQTLFDELAKQEHKPDYEIDTKAIIDAGLKGGIVGGGLQGGGSLAVDALRMGSAGYKAGLPQADAAPQDTAPEPLADIRAQIANTPEGEGNWYTRENAEQARQVAAEHGKAVRELADGSVAVATEDVLAQLPAEPTQADLARLNGYTQTKDEALADPAGTVAVEARDADGAALRNQLVGATVAEAARAALQQKFPQATVTVTSPEAVVEQRAAAVEQEQADAKPKWQPKGLLAEGDVTGWVNRAVELGIDTTRFQKTGLGEAVVQRARSGLQAQVPGNRERRLDSLEALAGLLDLPAQQLRREYYDSRNVIKGRDQLHQVFTQRVAERFGGPAEFAKAVDNLPAPEARAIQQALGVKEEGGYDLGALRAEIAARESSPDAAKLPPSQPVTDERVPTGRSRVEGRELATGVRLAYVVEDGEVEQAKARLAAEGFDTDFVVQPMMKRVEKAAEEPATPARQAQPDQVRDAVFNTPLLRRLLTTPEGKAANAVQIDEALDSLSPGERLRLEETLKRLDIDVGGQNHEKFLQLLEESVVGPTTYGIGRQLENEEDSESGYRVVPTVEQQPSLLDSGDARFVSTVRGTRLTDRDRSGGQVGLSTYLLAMAKILRAGEPEQQSALSEEEAVTLNHARVLGGVVDAALRMDPRIERAPLLVGIATALGVDEALLTKAAGRELAVEAGMAQLTTGVDRRAARALLLMLSRQNGLDGDQQNLEATLLALASNPEGAVRGLADSLRQLYGNQVVEDAGLISFYELNEASVRDEQYREDGTPRNPAFERGGDHSLNVVNLPENEQAASDSQFFGRMLASAIKGWRLAVLPTAEQRKEVVFDNALAAQVTQRFEGKNLLALPQVDGTLYGRVIDAVSLTMYAQSGERAPTNAAEAASNLLDNISRLMAGAQNSHDTQPGVAKAVVRTIPDDLVIFIDPVNGKGVTFGEALNSRRAGENARLRQKAVQRELDDVTDAIDRLADSLAELAADLENRAPDYATHPAVREAVERWRKMLAGETYVDSEGRRRYYRKPERGSKDKALRAAMDAIGKLKVGDESLDAAFGRYLGLLSQRKQLAQESAVLSAEGAPRNAPSEEQIVAGKLGEDLDTAIGSRRVDEALRGGQRTAVLEGDPDSVDSVRTIGSREAVDPEFNAYAHDPLSRFGDTAAADLEDVLQDQRLASLVAQLEGKAERTLASPVSPTPRPQRLQAKTGNDRIFDNRFKQLVAQLRRIGVPLPELRLLVLDGKQSLDAQLARLQLAAEAEQRIRDHVASGDSFYFAHEGVAHIVIAERQGTGARAHQLSDLAHELGHVVKDMVWGDLLAEHRDGLLAAARAELRVEPSEHLLHEWFADQFAKSLVEHADQVSQLEGGLIEQAIRALLQHLKKIWTELMGEAAEANPAFRRFAQRLFAGEYAQVKVAPAEDQSPEGRRVAQWNVVRFASGAEDVRAARRGQVLATQATAFWNKGVVPKLAPAFSMVYSRIARYSPELSRLLFQPAGARNALVGQSWEQRSRALQGRMMAQVDRLLTEFHQGSAKRQAVRDLELQAAFEDAYSGQPQTALGQRIRQLVDNLVLEAERAGLKSVTLGKGFAPIAFDRQAVAARQGDFEKLVADKLKLPPREVRELVDRILNGPGTLEGVITPGLPVGAHRTTLELVEAIGRDQLLQGGWLLRRHDAALFHWVNGVAKRAAWEGIFGAHEGEFVERNGRIEQAFNPNAKFQALVEQVRDAHGEQAAQEIHALVNGALGRHPAGQSMPGWWRNTQEFITGWIGMTILAFSGIASIPELALPLVRAGGRVGIGQLINDLGQARRFARDMGIVLSDASEQVMWQMTGEQYQSPGIRKLQHWFFRLNGNELIVRTSRTLATGIGIRYLLNAVADGDHEALQRLNIDAGTVAAWDAAGRPAWSPELDPALQGVAAAVSDAVNQFVNEATLNPSRFQATHWGNNPYLKMIWHLKHFLYTYGDTVLGGMYREMRRRWQHLDPKQFGQAVAIGMPALVFALAVLPLAAGSLELRDWVRRLNGQRGQEYEGALDYFGAVFSRAGGLGPLEFLANLRQQQEWGMSIWGSLSPTAGKVDMLFGEQKPLDKMRGLIPIWSQNKTLFGLLE